MILKGKVHKFGDNINTDDIIAAKYLVTTDEEELGKHCMENIAAGFPEKVNKGDIIVAGKNFGCGSSREHAPRALKGCGISVVVARSFAGIFFRNSINVGLPFLQLEDVDKINDGDSLEIDLTGGIIKNLATNKIYKTEPFPEFLQEIVTQGGLMNWMKKCTK
ncbi:MAG: 3-isopropylmalate dehydratase small subunit [Candidatus Omnitrophota bacterium]